MIHRRPHKYGAKPATDMSGTRRFASQAERDRFEELALLERGGVIRDLVCQPRVELEPEIFFKPDFSYTENGQAFFEDVKGFTGGERFRLICKLWKLHGPAPLRITQRARRGGFLVTRTIVPPPVAPNDGSE